MRNIKFHLENVKCGLFLMTGHKKVGEWLWNGSKKLSEKRELESFLFEGQGWEKVRNCVKIGFLTVLIDFGILKFGKKLKIWNFCETEKNNFLLFIYFIFSISNFSNTYRIHFQHIALGKYKKTRKFPKKKTNYLKMEE